MKNITLKQNEALEKILFLTGKDKTDFVEHVLNAAIDEGVIDDDPDYCGVALYSYFYAEGFTLTAATLYCLCKSTKEIEKCFSELVVWGVEDECPLCGCELTTEGDYTYENETGEIDKVLWEKTTCQNSVCNYEENEDNEPDPDRVWDDRIMSGN